MQFPTADDDDDADFLAAGSSRSRLSSLFQTEKSPADVNQALTFTAPKQPKKDAGQGSAGTMQLIHAVVVHTYKLKDGHYVNQGKLGCAVLGHHESHTYKLLLYKGKQVQVTVASLTPNFLFHVQPNNYANFYDEKKENWSINFDSEANLFEFTKQVTLAKANSQGKTPESLVVQDLVKGEGHSLENGNTAEIRYTGWLLTHFGFGQVFDSNANSESLFRVRLGKGKVIKGLNDGLVGMQKGGKRLLIIPPDLAYGAESAGSTVPAHSTLIFEVHVVKVKLGHESSPSPSPVRGSENKPEVPPRHSFSQEDNIRTRGASISEQLTQSPKKDKAQLISRMAKMGTATLPFQGAIPAQLGSDSDSEVEARDPSSPAPRNPSPAPSPKAPTRTRSRNDSGSSAVSQTQPIPVASLPFHAAASSSQVSLYAQSAMPAQQPFVCAATPFSTFPQQFSMPQSPYLSSGFMPPVSTTAADSQLSYLVSETRNQNTEVRISLSKITDKVDTLLQKVDDIRLQGRNTNNSMPYMENSVILQNIERVIQENARLREDNDAKMSKIQSLNEIICDLFQRNPRFSEESAVLGQKNELLQAATDQSQEDISNLQQEKSKLQLELSSVSGKLNKLENDIVKYQKMEVELNEKLAVAQKQAETQTNLLQDAREKIKEDEGVISALEEKLKSLNHENDLLKLKLESIEEKHTRSVGSTELVEVYKKEIQEYKEKIDELNSVISNSVPAAQVNEEKEQMKQEMNKVSRTKDQVEFTLKEMQKKMDDYEELKLSYEDKIRQMESEVDHLRTVKKKYEVFHEKTRALKESYEKQILDLLNKIKHMQSSGISPEFSVEIKKVMNRLYKILQAKFESEASYSGSIVLEVILQAIMALTFQLLESSQQSTEQLPNHDEPADKMLPQQNNISEESDLKESVEENGLDESLPEATPVEVKSAEPESVGGTSPVEGESESLVNHETPVSKVGEMLSVPVSDSSKRESPESPGKLFSGSEGSKVSEASLQLHAF